MSKGTKNELTKKRKNDKWSNFCVRSNRSLSDEELEERFTSDSNCQSIRNNEQWSKIGWDYIQSSREAEFRNNGKNGSYRVTNSDSIGQHEHTGQSQEIQQRGNSRLQREESKQSCLSESPHGSNSLSITPKTSTNSNDYRRQKGVPFQTRHEGKNLQLGRSCPDWYAVSSDPNYNGFWPTFASEEEKSEWWASSTAKFRDWWKVMPETSGIYDGITTGLHEKFRRARIKQLGNGIVSPIVEIIGNQIIYHEYNEESQL